ncbi:unnamed protein product [Adineta steineri]|uniref:F-box domain-containing protein n=1 Tax=Adineta steineri TaxID=433720 RepID=A0A814SWY6_9BILA|nr:unnamed protein product [Adineta steineri]CAF3573979.1 unnamed protein product [Adineta steineri]
MKRQRNKKIIEQNVNNKKKLSITQFEDLSNELIYEIFDYIDYCLIYEIFVKLNLRLHSLFYESNLSLKINFPLTSKSIFQYRCKYIINSNIKRIISLNICKYFLEFFSINLFSSLKSLTVNQIQSDKISTLLSNLICLPNFSFLSIYSSNYFQDENSIYLSIFRLTKLKFCKLTFPSGGERVPLPIAIDSYHKLERLIINGHCRLEQLNSILSYLPVLQHLSCQYLYGTGRECKEIQIPKNLTSIHLTIYRILFEEMKLFLSKISLRLKILRIKTFDNDDYFHAEQWEDLIVCHMPFLCIFDLQYSVSIDKDTRQLLIDRFSSKFWIEKQWFFDYYYYYKDEYSYYLNFFSIVPYRYDEYVLHEKFNENKSKLYKSNNINFARHLILEGCLKTNQYSIQFPRATKLTLKDDNIPKNSLFINDMKSIIPLLQITELSIKDNVLTINQFIEILCLFPNVQTLTLSNKIQLGSKRTNTRQLLSRNNRITHLIIDDDECQFVYIDFLIDLFPHLEYLEISLDENHLEEILRFLFLKLKYLFSLFLLNINYDTIEKIQILIKNEKLITNYTIERIHGGLYLWW